MKHYRYNNTEGPTPPEQYAGVKYFSDPYISTILTMEKQRMDDGEPIFGKASVTPSHEPPTTNYMLLLVVGIIIISFSIYHAVK